LHDVRRLVGSGVEVWRLREGHMISGRVCCRSHALTRQRSGTTDVRLDARHVVRAEGPLDEIQVR
jgi:hypothetical protein